MAVKAAARQDDSNLLHELRRKARRLLDIHTRNMLFMLREAQKLLKEGDVRDAAEKAYAAYKALLGALVARYVDRIEKMLLEKMGRDREKGLREAKWWLEKGLEIPSRAVGPIALTLSKLLEDEELDIMADEAILLHKWFYGGDELVEGMTKEKAKTTIRRLLAKIGEKAKHYI